MSKIYESTPSYSILKKYIIFAFKQFYSEFIVVGKENIPQSGPVIYAPNHTNALMDALAVISSIPQNQSIVYLARSDIFNNKIAAKILRFAKIMPAFRMRDGIQNLSKNDHTFEHCIEILDKKHALGIMPEGDQGEQKKIRPLRKGIFRIAFTAQQKYGTEPGVKIIPVGIVLEDLIKFGKPIIISFGKPIEVSEYMITYNQNPVMAMNEIKAKLKSDLNNLTLNLDTTNYYECFETAIAAAESSFLKQPKFNNITISKFIAQHKIVEKLKKIEKKEPEKMEKINILCKNYKSGLNELKIQNLDVDQNSLALKTLIFEQLYLISTSGFFILGFLFNFIPFYLPLLISRKIIKVEYPGFLSSIHYVIGLISFPLLYVLQLALINHYFNLSIYISVAIFLSQYILGKFAFKWVEKAKKLKQKLHYLRLKSKKRKEISDLKNLKSAIIHYL